MDINSAMNIAAGAVENKIIGLYPLAAIALAQEVERLRAELERERADAERMRTALKSAEEQREYTTLPYDSGWKAAICWINRAALAAKEQP